MLPSLVDLRRAFHRIPEVGLSTYKTAEQIERTLDALSISHLRVGDAGVLGVLRGAEGGRIIALRADTDALPIQEATGADYASQHPGAMHACGHDAHTAALLYAAAELSHMRHEWRGEIRLLFQPAEEIGQGARVFIREGHLKSVDRVFGLHVTSLLPTGKIALRSGPTNASCDYFRTVVRGKGAHVSMPQAGVDALYAASQIVVALQAIAARQTSPLDSIIVGVGTLRAGTVYNAIAEEAVLEGTTRSFDPVTRERVNSAVVRIARQTAEVSGATAETEFRDYAAPLVNDATAFQELYSAATQRFGAENLVTGMEKSLGADDFADYLAVARGLYAFVGTADPKNPATCLSPHNAAFNIDENALPLMQAMHVTAALAWLGEARP